MKKTDSNTVRKSGWKLKAGNICFRFRAISVLPLIILCYFFFEPFRLGRLDTAVNIAGFLISFAGAMMRWIAVGYSMPATSGRENFLKAENLNTSGIYSVVRNPLYLGNFLLYNGMLIAYSSPIALILMNIFFVFNYYFIILSEENYLAGQFGKVYLDYLESVPKMIPSFKNYKGNERRFNLLKVLFKEKNTTFYWIFFFTLSLLLKQYKLNAGALFHFWWHALPVLILFAINIALTAIRKFGKPELLVRAGLPVLLDSKPVSSGEEAG